MSALEDNLPEAHTKAEEVAAHYPEEFRGFVAYLALNDHWIGGRNSTGVDGVRTYEGLVMKYGYPAHAAGRPDGVAQGVMKECYSNSFWLARDKDWIYVEGYAASKLLGLPVQHAWCVDPETGLVVDPTWTDGQYYFGIPMDIEFVARRIHETGYFGVLCNDWVTDHELIRKGFVTDIEERSGLMLAIDVGE